MKIYLLLAIAIASVGDAVAPSVSQIPLISPVIAQSSGCPRAEMLFYFETRNFYTHICEGSNNYVFYRGVSKSDGTAINLKATKDSSGTWSARNGSVLYRVNYTELVVTDNGKVVLRERVISPP